MVRRPSERFSFVFVLVYPAGNPSFASAVARLRGPLSRTGSPGAPLAIEQLPFLLPTPSTRRCGNGTPQLPRDEEQRVRIEPEPDVR